MNSLTPSRLKRSRRAVALTAPLVVSLLSPAVLAKSWSDGFEDYAVGKSLDGQGDWQAGHAVVVDTVFHDGGKSVKVTPPASGRG